MRAEEVARVAKGRIWSGRDAYQLGLVDELGGLTKAIALALAKQMAELPQVISLECFCGSCIAGFTDDTALKKSRLLCAGQRNCHQSLLTRRMVVR